MSLSILEVLRNAEYNLKNAAFPEQTKMGIRQLSNAIYLLDEKEKDLYDDFDEADLEGKPKQ